MADVTERYQSELFPSDYGSWRYCIEVKCKQAMSVEFIDKRISSLSDESSEECRRFAGKYGDAWRAQVLAWFKQARAEL